MSPFRLTRLTLSTAVLAVSVLTSPANPSQPNILLIVSDDAGYADFGFQGCKDIPTPHLDQLAGEGMRFTQGYVAGPVCSPSRAGILSGKTPARIGHENNLSAREKGIDTGTVLLPARLKEVGYHTGAIGKWHLGAAEPFWPWERGFDEFYGFLGGTSTYLPAADNEGRKLNMLRNGVKMEEKEYTTTAFEREAVQFIEQNKGKPWFLYLAFNAVHSPMQSDPGTEDKLTGIQNKQRRTLAAMTVSLDDSVGRVLAALKASGQYTNTLVLFVNDNGGATYSKFYNTPLRGHKGTLFEGGVRVPFLARWPGTLPAGKEYAEPICATDLLPTFLAAAGAPASAWSDSDGVDLMPYWTGTKNGRPHDKLFWRFNVVAAVRDGDWKLIRIKDHDPLLFNLAEDLSEKNNVADAHPEKVKAMLQDIANWEKPFPAAGWTEGPNWEKKHIEDHIGPPVYQGPIDKALFDQE